VCDLRCRRILNGHREAWTSRVAGARFRIRRLQACGGEDQQGSLEQSCELHLDSLNGWSNAQRFVLKGRRLPFIRPVGWTEVLSDTDESRERRRRFKLPAMQIQRVA